MRVSPILASAAAHSLAQSVWTSGALAASLVYVLVPFAIHLQKIAGVQAISAPLETTLPPTPGSSRVWADPEFSF